MSRVLARAVAAVLVAASAARAQTEVRARYTGATASALAGAGTEGFNVVAVGGDVFVGVRLGRWASLEGFFAYHFPTQPSAIPGGGALCSGSNERWHWHAFGTRFWFHLLHLRSIDVSVAPTLAFGVAVDRTESPPGTLPLCFYPPQVTVGWSFDGGLDFGVEVRPAPWLGLRTMLETALNGGSAGYHAFGVVSYSTWIGPVFRF